MQLKFSLNRIRKLIDDIRKSLMYTQLNCPKQDLTKGIRKFAMSTT